MHRRARVRLREGDRAARVRASSAGRAGPPPRSRAGSPRPGSVSPSAVAEEREVVVRQPLEERRRLGGPSSPHLARRPRARSLAHRRPVLDRARTSPITRWRWPSSSREPAGVGLAVHLGVDHGLADRALLERLAGREHLDEPPVRVAADVHHRMDDQVHAEAAPVQLHAHRVDQERHVVGHDLDRRVRGLPAVLLEARVVDAHLRRARRPLAREVEVPSARP